MDNKTVLVIDNESASRDIIERTLRDAQIRFRSCDNSNDGWNIVRTSPVITSLVIRMQADGIDGCELTRRIRQVKSHDQFSILMIVAETQLEVAASAIDAGATDVLIDPFEAREFRMRMNIQPARHRRRVDAAHSSKPADGQEVPNSHDTAESVTTIQTLIPTFDPESLRFAYAAPAEQVEAWKNDESVSKLAFDQLMVCPCCGSVPSFRYGCGTCGSAATKPETLIHHYACAHVAAEAEFLQGHGIQCPKCRKSELVAGSDFEVVPGGHACLDCGSKISEPELIGHCLACQHRFPAREAAVEQLTALRISHVQHASTNEEQTFRPVKRRPTRQRETEAI